MRIENGTPMHLTESPLTVSFRRAEMRAFWLVGTVTLALILYSVSAALGEQRPLAWGAGAFVLVLPGLIWSRWFELGVSAWNRGVWFITYVLRAYTLRVCYYVLFAAVGRAGSSLGLELAQTESSRWISRARRETPFENHRLLEGRTGWGRELLDLAGRPGRRWMVCLLPVVAILYLLRDKQPESVMLSSTYTLY
jgi:hypothetical protein